LSSATGAAFGTVFVAHTKKKVPVTATDAQVRIALIERKTGRTQQQAAAKGNLSSRKTVAKYEKAGRLPSELRKPRCRVRIFWPADSGNYGRLGEYRGIDVARPEGRAVEGDEATALEDSIDNGFGEVGVV